MSRSPIAICCLLISHEKRIISPAFHVRLESGEFISDLKDKVKEKIGMDVRAVHLTVWKLSQPRPSRELTPAFVSSIQYVDERSENINQDQIAFRLDGEGKISKQGPWPDDEVIHVLVQCPAIDEIAEPHQKQVVIDKLALELREWCESKKHSPAQTEKGETLQSLGHEFPLQQCDSILQRLRSHMLDSFKFKFNPGVEWLKSFSIPIVGAASGTGKSAICSRFLDEMSLRASEHSSPRPSAVHKEIQHHGPPNTSQNINDIEMIVAESEGHLPKQNEFETLPLDPVWTEARLDDFREKVKVSADRKLTLRVDLMNSSYKFSSSAFLEADLAAALLDAYLQRFSPDRPWLTQDYLTVTLARCLSPLNVALRVLRTLENDNIIVIHVDETQAVSSERLQTL
ncbi:hypothetical protein C0992_007112, partial [Termitomyces sp. T32_za158]